MTDNNVTLLILIALYFVPTFVAERRRHRNRMAIGVMNLFLGWTMLGWVGALIWACTEDTDPKPEKNATPGPALPPLPYRHQTPSVGARTLEVDRSLIASRHND